MVFDLIKFNEQLQKHSTKSVSLRSPNHGSDCERRILAYKKKELCLIRMLYVKNCSEECFIGFKAHARDVFSVT